MKKNLLLLLVLLFTGIFSPKGLFAIDTLSTQYEKKTIYLDMNIWRTRFVQNGEQKKTGFMYRNLTNILKQSPDTHIDIRRFQKRQTISYITRFIGYGLSLAATITHYYDRDENTIVLVGGDMIMMVISRLFSWSAKGPLNRAIWLYNRDVVSGKIGEAGLPKNRMLSIGFSYSF